MRTPIQFLFISTCAVLLACLVLDSNGYALKCDRVPEGAGATKSPADGRYRIRIQGNPERYNPGGEYHISLVGIRSLQTPHKFTGFMLSVEKDDGRSEDVGRFQLMDDTLAKFSERCNYMVTHTSAIPKTDVQVLWTAPPPGSGCVVFRATVIEHRDVWYMDDGPLSKMFCEEEQDSIDVQPRIEDPCCACQEAKYEVTFEGLWSRHTHPKDYPSNRWLTRFSDIIGASHTVDYRFWEYGQQASEGVQQVAEHGSTRMLESELKSQSDHIRTIIKARGISYPNVTGKTFAVFRVDSKHHLVSLISMIDPSPDWIVGVSGLELCLSNCSWIEQKTLNLYPWDAGTDSGPTYTSPDQPTHPKDVVRRIKSDFPNDPRSPFYDPNGQDMKPMARIYFTRQRLYDKNCDTQSAEDERQSGSRGCETSAWSSWGPCSSQCGKGERFRQREYLDKIQAPHLCNRKLTQREECIGSGRHCHEAPREEDTNEVYPECALTDWSEWSECSVPCGKGVKTRSRQYIQRSAMKRCSRATSRPPDLEQTISCMGQECGGDITEEPTRYGNAPEEDRGEPEEPQWPRNRPKANGEMGFPMGCKWSEWSKWSPCNTNCGGGKKMRYRFPLRRDLDIIDVQRRATDIFAKLSTNKILRKDYNEDDEEEEEMDVNLNSPMVPVGENEHELMRSDCEVLFCFPYSDPCNSQEFFQIAECGGNLPSCADVPPYCFEDPVMGHCRASSSNRWYFDREKNDCGLFWYSGCGGNENNFMSMEECLSACKFLSTPERNNNSYDSLTVMDHKRQEPETRLRDHRDCVLTTWERGPCNVTCGEGMRRKTRRILSPAQSGGRPCPRKLSRFERCHVPCENNRYDTNPSWGPSGRYQSRGDCQYTQWTPWSPCSRTCGDYSVQTRTRMIVNPVNGQNCAHRFEERRCNVMPCY